MHSRNPVLLIPGFLWMSPFSWVSTGVLSLQTSAQRQWGSREYLGGDNVIDSEVLGEFLGLKDSNISQQPPVFSLPDSDLPSSSSGAPTVLDLPQASATYPLAESQQILSTDSDLVLTMDQLASIIRLINQPNLPSPPSTSTALPASSQLPQEPSDSEKDRTLKPVRSDQPPSSPRNDSPRGIRDRSPLNVRPRDSSLSDISEDEGLTAEEERANFEPLKHWPEVCPLTYVDPETRDLLNEDPPLRRYKLSSHTKVTSKNLIFLGFFQ